MRLTKLDAVNEMLAAISEAPVNSLETGVPDAALAVQLLDRVSRQVQERGWWFNSDDNIQMLPDREGFMRLPSNCLRVDEADLSRQNLTQRGDKLYDRATWSFKFPADKAIKINMVTELAFDETPEVMKEYVLIRAARMFQDRTIGDQQLHGYQMVDEKEAFARLRQAELEAGDFNFLESVDMRMRMDRNITSARYW